MRVYRHELGVDPRQFQPCFFFLFQNLLTVTDFGEMSEISSTLRPTDNQSQGLFVSW